MGWLRVNTSLFCNGFCGMHAGAQPDALAVDAADRISSWRLWCQFRGDVHRSVAISVDDLGGSKEQQLGRDVG